MKQSHLIEILALKNKLGSSRNQVLKVLDLIQTDDSYANLYCDRYDRLRDLLLEVNQTLTELKNN